jgi:hypothetical protein
MIGMDSLFNCLSALGLLGLMGLIIIIYYKLRDKKRFEGGKNEGSAKN